MSLLTGNAGPGRHHHDDPGDDDDVPPDDDDARRRAPRRRHMELLRRPRSERLQPRRRPDAELDHLLLANRNEPRGGFIGTLPASGDILDFDSWQMLTAISCDLQCCTGAGVRADAQFGNSADGTIAIVSDCGSFTCSVGYAGAMTR
jgi:hypothetical protein